jgi:hypothetical protein
VSDLEMLIMLNPLQDVDAWQKDVKSRPQSITSKCVIQQDNCNKKKMISPTEQTGIFHRLQS